MDVITRSRCCICDSSRLDSYIVIPNFPIYMGTTLSLEEEDIFHNQTWVVCQECGCLQLAELIPLNILYSNEHSAGEIGEIWRNHHKQFADFILEDRITDICEIGAAHGELARIILNKKPTLEYSIIEPVPFKIHPKVKLTTGFVEDHLDVMSSYENIVHSHVLEHVYKPADFILKVSKCMGFKSSMYISFPNIERLIQTRGTNSLNFEHTYFLHLKQLSSLMQLHGLMILRQAKYLEHSYFLKVGRIEIGAPPQQEMEILNISHSVEAFREMWEELAVFVNSINLLLDHDDTPTFIFGAHVFSQSLISLGLNQSSIEGVLDNANSKHGKRVYGTRLWVYDPAIIQEKVRVRVILKTGHYQEEIRNQLLQLNPLVEIIE